MGAAWGTVSRSLSAVLEKFSLICQYFPKRIGSGVYTDLNEQWG